MADRSRAFQVKIVGDVADAKRSLQTMEKDVGKFKSTMGNVAKIMGAAFAVKQVYEFGKAMVDRAEEMKSAYDITAKIIEQTGGAAGVSAEDVKALNKQLSLKTGIDKQLITTSSNVLLTFKSIRNEVGEGNDVFSRANALALDMSTVFGQDAKSSATQLGKALEDPIKGIAALARVGVTFTAQQKDQIKTLVESGNTLEAQKMILAAIEGQVGGTAEASADATAKISNGWKEVQEWVGSKILPILDSVASWVWETAIPAFEKFGGFISEIWGRISSIFHAGADDQLGTISKWAGQIKEIVGGAVELIRAVIDAFVKWGSAIWASYGEQIIRVFRSMWTNIKAGVDLILGVLKGLIHFVTAIFKGDWAGAWDAVKEIVGSFWEFFKTLPKRLVEAIGSMVGIIGHAAGDLGKALVNALIGLWNKLDPKITLKVPDWVPIVGGKKWTSGDLLPDIPTLAEGGIAYGPTLALIGEGSNPEAVVPLPARGLGANYTIRVEAGVGDPVVIGAAVVDAIVAFERSSGSSWRDAADIGAA